MKDDRNFVSYFKQTTELSQRKKQLRITRLGTRYYVYDHSQAK